MEWPDPRLNPAELRTNAGRRFVPGPSQKGKGTTTISQGLQTTEGLIILGTVPFFQSAGNGPVPSGIEGLDFVDPNCISFDFVSKSIAGLQSELVSNFLGQRYLPFAGDSAECHVIPYCLTSLPVE
jgi:hypothetical protein